MPRGQLIQLRRDTAANWTSANSILASGEAGYETDTGFLKIGDGATAWVDLDYFSTGGGDGWTPVTASRALVSDVSGLPAASSITSAQLAAFPTDIAAKLAASSVSAYGLTLVDDADAGTARTTLGLGTLATQSGTFSGTSSGTNTGDQTVNITAARLGWYVVTDYGLVGDGSTDNSSALQTLITTVTAAGGGTIYFPAGVYLIAGALQDTGDRNAQILLPHILDTAQCVNITFRGALEPPTAFWTGSTTKPTGAAYSIIKSSLTGASGTAAVFGTSDGVNPEFNNLTLNLRNLICEAPPNPTFTFWNLSSCLQGDIEYVLGHCGSLDLNNLTQPTNTNSYFIKLPEVQHSSRTRVDWLVVTGWSTGMLHGEAGDIVNASFWGCATAVEIPFAYHPSSFKLLTVVWCTRALKVTGPHPTTISLFDTEKANGVAASWQNCVYDLDDANNYLLGDIKWISISANVGTDHTFLRNGGTLCHDEELGRPHLWVWDGSVLRAVTLGANDSGGSGFRLLRIANA